MKKHSPPNSLLSLIVLGVLATALVGCVMEYPPELVAADKALATAKQAGKDKDCPDLYAAAEKLKNDAYAICKPCDPDKAIALAKESLKKTNALCPPKPTPAPVAAKPPVPPVAVSLAAGPATVKKGECATLTWASVNATSVSIDQGIGRVDANGSRKVCPDKTTTYGITATGEGGTREASATVTAAAAGVDRLRLHVNFAFNKATMLKADDADVQKAVDFIAKHPDSKFSLDGYTDNVGREAYNQALSEKRADAVKEALVKRGIDAARIKTAGHGASDPVADNSTEKGRAENRRVEISIASE